MMNDLLQLKGTFQQKSNNSKPGAAELPKGKTVLLEQLESLKKDLDAVFSFWSNQNLLPGALISVRYKDVIAKSNRIKNIFSKGSSVTANSSIVGAKFTKYIPTRHIITHYIDLSIFADSIKRFELVVDIVKMQFDGKITSADVQKVNKNIIALKSDLITKSDFTAIIKDVYFVDSFYVDEDIDEVQENAIITLYETKTDTIELMKRLGISITPGNIMSNTTVLLNPDQLSLLKKKAPYLISMAVTDISLLDRDDFSKSEEDRGIVTIPSPKNEPVIGVIDTLFDERVYFSAWVESINMVSKDITIEAADYYHGTSVSSIIVDGPTLNPKMDDGCGRFRARHFGVAVGKKFSSFTILKQIEEIVLQNKDIKVWNLSLGSAIEINNNFISPEAAILDKIQYENDVIFIVAGTNKQQNGVVANRIGSPADSINSLVVNSVNFKNKPASYTRTGPVLSFFCKPDVSYYGGDLNEKIRVCTPTGEGFSSGTSIAAPWISRKMAYLVNVMGLSREIAKALIIDSASGWTDEQDPSIEVGHGVVPIRIDDIIKSKNEEIRFVLSIVSEKYDTYTYNLPVPINEDKFPFIARATLCYFPHCSRNQGVDYTNTELDIYFGRVKEDGIKSINENAQSACECSYILESNARKFYRKWDNVKQVKEAFTDNIRARKVYNSKMWGLSVKTKERTEQKFGNGIIFGLVVTLREINGVNRIEDFINQCSLRGWLVNRVNVDSRINIYYSAEEDIVFK
ncbi:MAG: S8 family peptidase [Clostridiales bacterium]|jgi:hypothetical protein|nr:S8 family peptidase [Clostridiales bacterium]